MMRTKSQSGRLARNKGANFERSVVKLLQTRGIGCRRNTGQAGSAGVQGCDIEDTDVWIECGHGKVMDPRKKFAQAELDRDLNHDDRPIAVIWKRDGMRSILVTMGLHDLHRLAYGAAASPVASEYQALATVELDEWIDMLRGTP